MAVEVQIDCHGVTLDQYDVAMEIGGLGPGGPSPPAGLFHYVKKELTTASASSTCGSPRRSSRNSRG